MGIGELNRLYKSIILLVYISALAEVTSIAANFSKGSDRAISAQQIYETAIPVLFGQGAVEFLPFIILALLVFYGTMIWLWTREQHKEFMRVVGAEQLERIKKQIVWPKEAVSSLRITLIPFIFAPTLFLFRWETVSGWYSHWRPVAEFFARFIQTRFL